MSHGSEQLKEIIRSIFGPFIPIQEEVVIGPKLRLDFFMPTIKLAYEYHGRQHEVFVDHFYKDAQAFREAKRRDELKRDLCLKHGIALVTLWYSDPMTFEFVKELTDKAMKEFEDVSYIPIKKEVVPNDEYKEKQKELRKKIASERYQKAKAIKKSFKR